MCPACSPSSGWSGEPRRRSSPPGSSATTPAEDAAEGIDVSADQSFHDRADAGRRLGAALADLARADVVVLGLPGGVVRVAFRVARALGAPLDVIVVRKVGVPHHAELAMGAVGEDGATV